MLEIFTSLLSIMWNKYFWRDRGTNISGETTEPFVNLNDTVDKQVKKNYVEIVAVTLQLFKTYEIENWGRINDKWILKIEDYFRKATPPELTLERVEELKGISESVDPNKRPTNSS